MSNQPGRKPEYLSPSSLACFEESPQEYYLRYLAAKQAPKTPQTKPMSAGSAFDAFAKSYLYENLIGKNPEYELATIFEKQVEKHNRTEAWKVGIELFAAYTSSGVLTDLMLELSASIEQPRFEFEIKGVIGEDMGVPLLGKPDVRFITAAGAHVIYDFKVNGAYAKTSASPTKGYIQLVERQPGGSWMRLGQHKNCVPTTIHGLSVNGSMFFDSCDPKWATQLATYSWLTGEKVGAESIVGIHQICTDVERSKFRIAVHCSRISSTFQFDVMDRYRRLWGILNSDPFHFFTDMTLEASQQRCESLEKMAAGMTSDSDAGFILREAR